MYVILHSGNITRNYMYTYSSFIQCIEFHDACMQTTNCQSCPHHTARRQICGTLCLVPAMKALSAASHPTCKPESGREDVRKTISDELSLSGCLTLACPHLTSPRAPTSTVRRPAGFWRSPPTDCFSQTSLPNNTAMCAILRPHAQDVSPKLSHKRGGHHRNNLCESWVHLCPCRELTDTFFVETKRFPLPE